MKNNGNSVRRHDGRYLPHLEVPCGTYFVTFCLKDAIPLKLLKRLKEERQQRMWELDRRQMRTLEHCESVEWGYFRKIDAALDTPASERLLARDDLAQVVADAFEFFNGKRYDLDCWVIMGTHIHVLFQLREGELLQKVLHSWKSFTAQKINRMLGRSGAFWQADYFDRSVRCDAQLDAYREYIWANPEAAGLRNWKWRRCYF